jgi:hypothetical protein
MQPKGMTSKHDERLLSYTLAAAGVLLLICAIYAEEDWRGKHTWTKLKAQLEAQGGHLDWTNYVPASVPDDENVFAVPEMKRWFIGRGGSALSSGLDAARTGFLRDLPGTALAIVTMTGRGQKVAASLPSAATGRRIRDAESAQLAAGLVRAQSETPWLGS